LITGHRCRQTWQFFANGEETGAGQMPRHRQGNVDSDGSQTGESNGLVLHVQYQSHIISIICIFEGDLTEFKRKI
jgi:hypothetical protein